MGGKIIHGHSIGGKKTPEFEAWSHMIGRCNNPKNKDYRYYGGRGIAVCERWLEFKNFLDDMGPRPPGQTIDRYPNNDGHYEPGNARWATRKQQVEGKRGNFQKGHTLTRGERSPVSKLTSGLVAQIREVIGTASQKEIARRFGVSQSNISMINTGKAWSYR